MPLTAPRYEIAIGSSSYRGIQTIRNWPGCPPKSPRKRYVIVVGVSRTSSRIGTTSNLGMGDPDRFRDGAESGLLEEGAHFLGDCVEHAEAFRDDCGPDLDGAGARHDVLEGVPPGSDASDADDGDVDFLADVVHRAHADRSDRGAAEAAELVREERHLQLGHDRHRLHRVDRNDAVRAAFLRGDRERGDVPDVRGELREDGQRDGVLDGPRKVPYGARVLGDLRAGAFHVRAREFELDRLDAVRGDIRRYVRVLVGVL